MYRTSRIFDAIFIILLLGGLYLVYQNKTGLSDWFFFLVNQPKPESIKLAEDAGLTEKGSKLFYRTNPQVTSKAEIAKHCDIENLGCITPSGDVYLQASEAHDETVVTAAHEMLHLAYRRLSQSQKAELTPLLNQAIEQINSSFLEEEISGGKDAEARLDEAHSVLGTEYPDLSPALEEYYKQYFTDRSKTLEAEQRSIR